MIIEGFDEGESRIDDGSDRILPIQTQNENQIPEQSLWRAVITQALSDCASNSNKKELRYEKAKALAWIHSDSADFLEVCEYAGFEPDYIKKKAKEALKRNCRWRKQAGYKKFLPLEEKRGRGRPRKINFA